MKSTDEAVVSCHNEWDPLEEVIVGIADGATIPPWHVTLKATMPQKHWGFFQQHGGEPFDPELVAAANRELDGFARVLEAEGVVVRRPEPTDFARPYSTRAWRSESGLYAAMPRDLLLVVGDEIIESPMAWRSRYHEIDAYRPLLKRYFQQGARWTAAPRPQLLDALYDPDYEVPADDQPMRYVLSEFEPVFDAADFLRCGRDILYIKSHTTNELGVTWLKRHLGSRYRFHELTCRDTKPMHIDTTFLPLAPGKLLVNPERFMGLPEALRRWEVLPSPPPCAPDDLVLYFSGKWLSMNVFSIDEKRVCIEAGEERLIAALKDWGFSPIPIPFRNFYRLGGSFHCATLDIRRRGDLREYC